MHDVTLDTLNDFDCPHCGMTLDAQEAEPLTEFACPQCGNEGTIPGLFGPFHLLKKQNESVTSILFDAFDPKLGRHVSLKILNVVLSKNSAVVEAFKKEALAAASLNSLYVLKVYEFGVHNRQPYMVMERIEGRFLHEILEDGPMNQREVMELTRGILQGLKDMHKQGIVHGDVVPRNILVHTDGTPRISDFGLARFAGDEGGHLQNWSSPYYMPPERIRGEPEDFRGDLYSLGTTLFYMLTGQLPFFDLEEEVVMERKLAEPAPDLRALQPDLHEAVAEFVGLLLHRDPGERPESYEECIEVLDSVMEFLPRRERTVSEDHTPPPPPPLRKNRREPVAWFVFLALAGILCAMILSLITNRRTEESVPDPTPVPLAPQASPTPAPTTPPAPTPTPFPTATPLPTPIPTPTPVPITLESLSADHILLLAPPRSSGSSLSEWRQGHMLVFQQAEPSRQPILLRAEDLPRPVLSFQGHHLVSTLTTAWTDEFTLVMVAKEEPGGSATRPQLLAGVHPFENGWTPFGIFAEPALPGGFRIKTSRGNARLSLPRDRRGEPFVVAFRRNGETQDAYLAGKKTRLPQNQVPPPSIQPDHLLSLQLGGTSNPEYDFSGWIGALYLADRALTDAELAVVFREFRRLFGLNP